MEKITTIELEHAGSTLIERMDIAPDVAVDNMIDYLRTEILENNNDMVEILEGESITYKIVIHKKRTEKYLSELGDFDGF